MRAKDVVGRYGEELVADRLIEQGWQVLSRNWRCRHGELDLVARDPAGALVAVEVKTRRSEAFGPPSAAITTAKLARLRRLTGAWLAAHPGEHADEVRIDVLAVLAPRSGDVEVTHLRAVG